ncbi:MAG: FKBP-type peptidyl-prolyl cis-trans isomerase [Gammaproteobacteria bacterium]|nr:FKBP-type peptidyl-prolyl cis-trans isomerase [Gammaproteobacteria bacterium]
MIIDSWLRLRHSALPALATLLFTTALFAQEQQNLTILGSTASWPTGRATFVSETDVDGLRIRHTRVDDADCGARDFLEFSGPLGPDTTSVIEPFLNAMQPCGSSASRGAVILSSGGGAMTDGYALGELLTQYGVATALVQGQVCASACVAAFLGGSPRYMLENAWLVLQSPVRRPGIGIDCENSQEVDALKEYFAARLGEEKGGLLQERAMSNCTAARGWTIQPLEAVALGIAEADNTPFTQQLADGSLNFMAENATRPGVITTSSGLQYEVISRGANADAQSPVATSRVTVNYHGTFVDGRVFDSSVERGRPAAFPLNQVIRGWTEGLQLMKPGDKFRFFIPPELAYGEAGRGPVPANTTLIFEIELLEIGGSN